MSVFEQYQGKGPAARQPLVRWFHESRTDSLVEFIRTHCHGGRALSVGCGTGAMESKLRDQSVFSDIIGLDVVSERVLKTREKGIPAVRASAPPLPFESNTFDTVVAAGSIEHLPDEEAFIRDASRILCDGGVLIVTLPIEVGIGGLLRFWGKNFVHPNRSDTPGGLRRYFSYTYDELLARTPRNKHGTAHRYYNYRYALNDLRSAFSSITRRGWPLPISGVGSPLNFILFVAAFDPV